MQRNRIRCGSTNIAALSSLRAVVDDEFSCHA